MKKQKIVIVGAGPSGLSTAFFLTDPATSPDWKERYEVDIYQLGWRVGGKGATGRNPDACERLQEHGIHVFGNMYFNTLRMMDQCYAEVAWDDKDQFRAMTEAFLPSVITLMTDYYNGTWHRLQENFPCSPCLPWKEGVWPDPHQLAWQMLSMLSDHVAVLLEGRHKPNGTWLDRLWEGLGHTAGDALNKLEAQITVFFSSRGSTGNLDRQRQADLVKFLGEAVGVLKVLYEIDKNNLTLRQAFLNIDLAATVIRGIVDDDLETRGSDSIDGENYREWLERHGLSKTTLESGTPQIFPNTAISYEYGDTTAIPTMSAMAFVHFFLRQLFGKGAGAYFFAEGTGETVMKPLYRLLAQRGVRFHFFHKLTAVTPDPESAWIEALEFDVQATVKGGSYEPLRRMRGTDELVWPDRPNFDQLAEGEQLRQSGCDLESWWTPWKPVGRRVLKKGVDFDQIVLATPITTLQYTCPALMSHKNKEARDAWSNMVKFIKSAASQAVQVWLNKPFTALGWPAASPDHPTDRCVGPLYNQDLTSFCDFSDLIAREDWPADNRPQSLLYLIGALSDPETIPPFDDHDFPLRQAERVKWSAIQYLRNINGLLPGAATSPVDPCSLDFSLLTSHDPATKGRGVNQFDQQYFRANIDPNERYTLSVKGSVQYRLEAWDSKFENLVLAGDWIYTGFNVGSFEGAVMSGKLACLALTGAPGLDLIYGYTLLHPDRKGPPSIRLKKEE